MTMGIGRVAGRLQRWSLPSERLEDGQRTFHLRRWFGIVSLVSIATMTLVGTSVFSRIMTDRMLRQEAVLTMEFVQSTFLVEKPAFLYGGEPSPNDATASGILLHLSKLPDVMRANLYLANRQLHWSSDASLIGKRFFDNPELEQALAGNLVVNEETEEHQHEHAKGEHANLGGPADANTSYFVEIYVPIWDQDHKTVLGTIELYKRPQALFEAIRLGHRLLWMGAVCGAVFLYLMLFWIISRADALILSQQAQLVENERLAAVGELGSAVAHGLRNPLAAIRSSAELALEGDAGLSREAATDIMSETDRLQTWINELLSYSRPVGAMPATVDLTAVLTCAFEGFGREMERRRIEGAAQILRGLPAVVGDSILYAQVFNSLLANAVEAVQNQGSIALSAALSENGRRIRVRVSDTGPGMTREQLAKAFRPFFTTKTKGLGVGLPLAKRIVERFGGTISINSEPGSGTRVDLEFAVAA
jgi:signal transduction histidine kinase